MSELQTSPEHHPLRPTLEDAAQTTLTPDRRPTSSATANLMCAVTVAGSGIAVHGRALVGRHRIAGEWGHNPLPWPRDEERPGPKCYCGRRGCLETFVSGTGLAADHRRRTGQALTAEAVISHMRLGDAEAKLTYDFFLDRLARGLAHVVNILDPDVIVLGGGLSAVDELYTTCRRGSRLSSSRTRSTRPCGKAAMDRPQAFAAQPGCGPLSIPA